MARLVTRKDLDNLVTGVAGPVTAQTAVSKGQVLRLDAAGEARPANNLVSESIGRILGLATKDAGAGFPVEYQYIGPFQMPVDQGWSYGQDLYWDASGNLTATPPTPVLGEFIQIAGFALTSDTIFLVQVPGYPF